MEYLLLGDSVACPTSQADQRNQQADISWLYSSPNNILLAAHNWCNTQSDIQK
jgi:hypothetical protein